MRKQYGVFFAALGLWMCGGDEDPPPYTPPPAPATCTTAQAGNMRCTNTTLQTCTNGTWGTTANCTTTQQVCVATSATTAACQTPLSATCTAGETGNQRCNGQKLETCSGTDWTLTTTCVAPSTCATLTTTTAECAASGVCAAAGAGVHYVCAGDVVTVCEDNVYDSDWDCADLAGDGSVPAGMCHDFGGAWEADCVFGAGTPCAFDTGSGLAVFACGTPPTPSATMGCDLGEGCVSGQTACTPSDTFAPVCNNNRLIVDCFDFSELAQPMLIDCTSADNGSGTCETNVCKHSTSGAFCSAGYVECISPLVCSSATGAGTCGAP